MAANMRFCIITVSDSSYGEPSKDRSGPTLERLIMSNYEHPHIVFRKIVPDHQPMIEYEIRRFCERMHQIDVVILTGGTGFSPRDVTPEATRAVIEREAPGLAMAMIIKSLEVTEMGMLSRMVCGIRHQTIVVNMPGSEKACIECFSVIRDPLKHAVSLLRSSQREIIDAHTRIHNPMNCTPSKVVLKVAERKRESPYEMLEVSNALQTILTNVKFENNVTAKTLHLDCLDDILAEDITAPEPHPPFAASLKDGYACLSSEEVGVKTVKNFTNPGDNKIRESLNAGEVIRISTGAPIPSGADCVVQVENTRLVTCSEDGTQELEIELLKKPVQNQDIRPQGADIPKGSLVLPKGHKITYATLGVLATLGYCRIKVFSRPKIAIISTGNELQPYSDINLAPFHIRDSNKIVLMGYLKKCGFASYDYGIAKDTPDSVKQKLFEAFNEYDVVITTGGVSMGEFDVIKKVLETDFVAKIHFGRVNMKPGKPTTFATCEFNGRTKYIFGLPGNPVSALVTSILFVTPALKTLRGDSNINPSMIKAKLKDFDYSLLDPRPEYLRVNLTKKDEENEYLAVSTGDQLSSRINSFVNAQGLLKLPGKNDPEAASINKDTLFDVILFDQI